MQHTSQKFSQVSLLLSQEADYIQHLATEQHKKFLGKPFLRNEYIDKYIVAHIVILKKISKYLNVEDLKKGTTVFKRIGTQLAKESLRDGLTLEESVDGTLFLKQAIWIRLKEKGVLNTMSTEEFYELSFTIGTYCDVLISKIAFVYLDNFVQQLHQQAAHKDEFMSIATHELKTPVTSLKAFAQVLQKRFAKAGDEKSALHMAKMDAQLNKLTSLIGDLLDATKIDAGKLQFHEEYFDFNELVLEIIEEMQMTTQRHTIHTDLAPTKTLYGDKTRIGQVIINLFSNAIKYSPNAKQIIARTVADKDQLTFSLQDFGIGIAKKDHNIVFERFQRVGDQYTFGGLGLGLFIATNIIQRHGGKMWLDSEKGKGSTFSFTIPLKRKPLKRQLEPVLSEELKHE